MDFSNRNGNKSLLLYFSFSLLFLDLSQHYSNAIFERHCEIVNKGL